MVRNLVRSLSLPLLATESGGFMKVADQVFHPEVQLFHDAVKILKLVAGVLYRCLGEFPRALHADLGGRGAGIDGQDVHVNLAVAGQ